VPVMTEPVAEAYRRGVGRSLDVLLRLGGFTGGDRVVNLCAGAGIDNVAIAGRVGPRGWVRAVDADAGALGRLRVLAAKHHVADVVRPVVADATRYLPPADATQVVCAFGLHHLADSGLSTRTWARTVPAGTRLLLLDWGPRGTRVLDPLAGLPSVDRVWRPTATTVVRFAMPEPLPPVATIVIRRFAKETPR
jgi:ubiquinone/menaquinone biosynthesis C-methylase UbiE